MKIFQLIERSCAVFGLGPHRSVAQKPSKSRKIVRTFFIFGLACCSCCANIFVEAKSFEACAVSINISSTVLVTTAIYAICVWKNQPLFKLVDNIEQMVNESELSIFERWIILNCEIFAFHPIGLKHRASTVKYVQINLQVEKWTKIIHFVFLALVIPSTFFSKLFFCFYLYFSTDLGTDSFELPFPFWWELAFNI